jgi:hypothetical protein
MAERILGPTGSSRRRRFLFVPMLAVSALALMFVAGAQAVHDETFQLDGDVIASTTTSVGGTTQTIDWDSLFDAAGAPKALPAGFTASGFDKDFANTGTTFITSDTTTFATGSKDTLPISGWQCNFDNNVNSKIDVMNSYAASYTNADGDEIIYFGLERNTNTGDANVAFWFLQDNVNCSTTGAAQTFTGAHTDGDLLIVSAFSNGGTVSTIDVYRWNGGATGSLGTTPVAHGVDCRSASTPTDDTACATANTANITTPWLTANFKDGVGHTLRTAEFFEGGVNLTQANLGGKCFNTFIGDTRSSTSLTATLFDYARGQLGQCGLTVTTTPSQTTRVLGSTDPITDLADLSGTSAGGGVGPAPTGTVTFFLCSPSESTSGGCPSGSGTQVGTAVTLGACNPAVAGHSCATSANAASLITVLGTYCFRAVYDPGSDPNYQGKGGSFTSASECFTVTGTSGLSTAQNWVPNDTATLTGDANLNGTLTFTLYNDGTCGTTGSAVYSKSVTVTNATSGSTFSTDNTTTVIVVNANEGSYSWLVHYDDNVLSDPADRCETTTISITD